MLRAAVAAAATALVLAPAAAVAETLRLTTLDWPPYTGADLPGQGTTTETVRKAAQAAGMSLEVEVLPWARAVNEGLNGSAVGYFPEYDGEEVRANCHLSAPIGSGPVGLAETVSSPISWESLADLERLTIGVVAGYQNEPAFDAAVADGRIRVEPAVSDEINIRKLAAGRIDAIVVDSNVFAHLVAAEEPRVREAVRMDERLLAENDLYVCFRRTPEGEAARDAFDRGLRSAGG